jgi:predicted nuclease of predicted toxin-antitoxin system
MRFLLDENFPRTAVAVLSAAGHEVHDFRDEGSVGAPDQDVMRLAVELDAILLTTDKDFFHTVPFLFPDHPGTIVIALAQPDRESIMNRLQWALSHVSADLRSKCYLVTDRKLYLRSK